MEAKILEAREEFNGILDFVLAEAGGCEIHEVEREMFRRLLRLGRSPTIHGQPDRIDGVTFSRCEKKV